MKAKSVQCSRYEFQMYSKAQKELKKETSKGKRNRV
jgi:hypothetical protein